MLVHDTMKIDHEICDGKETKSVLCLVIMTFIKPKITAASLNTPITQNLIGGKSSCIQIKENLYLD